MKNTTIALITGANKGLGHESARRLAGLGWTVLLGSRDAGRGAAAAAEIEGDVHSVVIDVTDDDSVATAAKTIERRWGRLDVLVNNAGITGQRVGPRDTTADHMRIVLDTNTIGVVRVTHAFLPLLDLSAAPRIVMVTSGMGSFALTGDPSREESTIVALTYPASKAALNMITTQYAKALPRFRVNVADPGYTATDLNGHNGTQTVTEGTDGIIALATLAPDGPTGTFIGRSGPLQW
ncbi:SDR family NAD(P)-dependent oxidoreductase [Umezawaea tangerina]|uniref:NADP-dependent 3-hydroxy acid dehydrogenase YdfG n=1 Tax=Umezawaea tangerina TaxID=84725 RepID=A0A2T0SZT0_9PSEU|nr:SDR family NAD(P)-dependent oxidoreductase [Umezawaea tangerina]PRY38925.1 NADP-dependent 3-hydroxy acid dehydrogenase YdfG [Umezawaea tangerina]